MLSTYSGNGVWNTTTPCASTCQYVTQALYDMQKVVNDWHIPRGEKDYINGYDIVNGEYKDYYLKYCAPSDPVLDSAAVTPPNGSTSPAASNGGSPGTTPAKQLIKGIPNWALFTAGGLVLLIAIVAIVKKSN
jgi:hypothetical protein